MELTQKQETFCLDVHKGLTETDAYRNSYNVANMGTNSIYVEACRLKANPKVALRLKELNAPFVKRIQSTKDAKLRVLEDIYSKPVEVVTTKNIIGALAEHNRMTGDSAPDINIEHQDNRVINIIVSSEKAKELTENVSKRLLEAPQSTAEPLIDEDSG